MIYLCYGYGDPEECPNCGGWTKAWTLGRVIAGQWTPIRSAGRGPVVGAFNVSYCSEDCAEEAERYRAVVRTLGWCPSCGYDNHEHAESCNRVLTVTPGGG